MTISAKNLKDITNNIRQMHESEDVLASEILNRLQDFTKKSLSQLEALVKVKIHHKAVVDLRVSYEQFYMSNIDFIYKSIATEPPKGIAVSTMTCAIKKTISSLEDLTDSIVNFTSISDEQLEQ
jgi:hypothetical protein